MQPLEGLRVVDLADEKGELAGRLLCDLGAEVIRVEPPEGARSRRLPPFAPDGKTSLYFATRNAGKRGIVLDLDDADGRQRLHELLADADIAIESFAPGALAERGLAPTALLERHPQLILASITDFGQTGPYRDYQGTDMIGYAMSGMMHRSGIAAKPPLVIPGSLAYDVAGVSAVHGVLLATLKRFQTGRGQHLDVSAMEATHNLSDWSMPNYSVNPLVGARAGAGIYTLYRCADGFIRMIILVKHHWHALLDWVGNPPELADPALDQFVTRLMQLDRIVPVLETFFRDKKKVDVAREAQCLGIPATPLLTPSEVLHNEHTLERGSFRELEVGDGLKAQVASGFLTIEGERAGPRQGPPSLDATSKPAFSPAGEARRAFEAIAARSKGGSKGDADDGYPLRGVRVLDFGVGAVGVEAARLLAEFGADVIKVESHKAPDFIRTILSSFMNPCFASSSRSKRCIGVDLKTVRGRELVEELVRQADVVIDNNGAGVMDRLGFGAAALRKLNPRIVSFSSQLVGSRGPWKNWIGYGPSTHPVSGLQYLWNFPEDAESPAGSTNVHPDHFVGRLGAVAVLAGLIQREHSGRGMHADGAQFEAAMVLLGDLLAQESLAPGSVQPLGNASLRGAPWGCYRCQGEDEWCVVNVRSDEEWQGLCAALGESAPGDPSTPSTDWAREPALARAAERIARRTELDRGLEAWTCQRPPREVMETLQAHGVPASIVAHPGHLAEDPQLAARNYPKPITQPGSGPMVLEGTPFQASDLPPPIVGPAPLLGEHTREIARERLGLSDAEIDALLEEGVLEVPID